MKMDENFNSLLGDIANRAWLECLPKAQYKQYVKEYIKMSSYMRQCLSEKNQIPRVAEMMDFLKQLRTNDEASNK